jgi:hypothetical protein
MLEAETMIASIESNMYEINENIVMLYDVMEEL